MTRANKALAVMIVAAFGLWGCAQGPGNGSAERIKALETKCAKLEDDYRAVAAVRDQLRKKVTEVDELSKKMRAELDLLQPLTKENEEIKQQLLARTSERDSVQGQFDQFRKNIRSLLGQAETAAPKPATPAVSAAPSAGETKS